MGAKSLPKLSDVRFSQQSILISRESLTLEKKNLLFCKTLLISGWPPYEQVVITRDKIHMCYKAIFLHLEAIVTVSFKLNANQRAWFSKATEKEGGEMEWGTD